MALNLPPFPAFELSPRETVATRFEKWVKKLNILYTAIKITDANQKKAILLHYGGDELCDIFDTLTIPEGEDVYTKSVDALTSPLCTHKLS